MIKKTLFEASFEESLNLEDDAFLRYYNKEQNEKMINFSFERYSSLKAQVMSLVLTLIFPIFLNFMIVPILMVLREDSDKLTLPISNQEFLTVEVYLCCLLLWLMLVLIGKQINRIYLFPYRFHFHTVTYLIWLVLEFDLAAIEFALPTLTIWGILGFFVIIILIGYWMARSKYHRIREILYGEQLTIGLQDKIAKMLSSYGLGILGFVIIARQLFSIFTGKFSESLRGLGLLLAWFTLNIGIVALLIFLEFPCFLYAYYKWKYPEEYREWEGKTLEEWYGKEYLKKHKELLKSE